MLLLSEYSAYLCRIERADERTRTADLLITSDPSGVAGMCRGLQNRHFQRGFFALPCPVLHRIAFPVVSEWYQYHPLILKTLWSTSSAREST
jgi:hypothetical protein